MTSKLHIKTQPLIDLQILLLNLKMKHFRKRGLTLHQLKVTINLTTIRNSNIFRNQLINKHISDILPERNNLCLRTFTNTIKRQRQSLLTAGDITIDNRLIEKSLSRSERHRNSDL